MKCCKCGRPIKHPYYFKGNAYGVECWKTHCLPLILHERDLHYATVERERYLDSWCDIEVLKMKDLSRINNSFKLQFIPSVIAQFEQQGFLSRKQRDIIGNIMNGRDFKNLWRIRVEAGLDDASWLVIQGMMELTDFPEAEHANITNGINKIKANGIY